MSIISYLFSYHIQLSYWWVPTQSVVPYWAQSCSALRLHSQLSSREVFWTEWDTWRRSPPQCGRQVANCSSGHTERRCIERWGSTGWRTSASLMMCRTHTGSTDKDSTQMLREMQWHSISPHNHPGRCTQWSAPLEWGSELHTWCWGQGRGSQGLSRALVSDLGQILPRTLRVHWLFHCRTPCPPSWALVEALSSALPEAWPNCSPGRDSRSDCNDASPSELCCQIPKMDMAYLPKRPWCCQSMLWTPIWDLPESRRPWQWGAYRSKRPYTRHHLRRWSIC